MVGFQPVVAWQLMQFVAPTGMWTAGLPVALLPLWQLAQFVAAVKLLWSTFAVFQLLVLLWQLSHTVWPACSALAGRLDRWHEEQLLTTVTLVCSLAGVHEV